MGRAKIALAIQSRPRLRGAIAFARLLPTRAILIAWIGALAIAFQCIVVQSHVHVGAAPTFSHSLSREDGVRTPQRAPQPAIAAAMAHPGDLDTRHNPSPTDPSGCFICQQMAMAGAAVLPPSPLPAVVQRAEIVHTILAAVAAPRPRASHDWRSRAPPIEL